MVLVLLAVLLFACPPGKPFVLRHSSEDPGSDQASVAISSSRCKGESLLNIRKVILDSLGLRVEPHVTVPGMTWLRDQWKTAFEGTGPDVKPQLNIPDTVSSSKSLNPGNSSTPKCCKMTSQIFTKDLDWDKWIIYPESFTYTRCSHCDPQMDQTLFHCAEDTPSTQGASSQVSSASSQMLCCEPTSYEFVPFLYIDTMNTLTISSVPMTHACGCRPVDDPQALQL